MFAILAIVCFLLAAFGLPQLGVVALLPLGLAFLGLHLVVPFTPWNRTV